MSTQAAIGLITLLGVLATGTVAILVAEMNNNTLQAIEAQKIEEARALEVQKIEAARVLEMTKASDPIQVQRNLYFLIRTGLLTNENLISKIKNYYETTDPTVGPAFPQVRQVQGIPPTSEVGQPTVTQTPPPQTPKP
jgi:hypothetical protein